MAVVLVKCCNAVAEHHSNARRVGLSEYQEWNNHYSGHPALHPAGQLKLFKSLQTIESASLCLALHPKNRTLPSPSTCGF